MGNKLPHNIIRKWICVVEFNVARTEHSDQPRVCSAVAWNKKLSWVFPDRLVDAKIGWLSSVLICLIIPTFFMLFLATTCFRNRSFNRVFELCKYFSINKCCEYVENQLVSEPIKIDCNGYQINIKILLCSWPSSLQWLESFNKESQLALTKLSIGRQMPRIPRSSTRSDTDFQL